MTLTHRSYDMTDPNDTPVRYSTCDIPGCKGRREILIMEAAMRCVCRKCFRQMEGATS